MMNYFYQFDEDDDGYWYISTWNDVEFAIKNILRTKSIDEIFDICQDLEDGDYNLEEYFYDELKEIFKDKAREEWKNSKNTTEDEKFDYWNAKL